MTTQFETQGTGKEIVAAIKAIRATLENSLNALDELLETYVVTAEMNSLLGHKHCEHANCTRMVCDDCGADFS